MKLEDFMEPARAPITAELYERMEERRAEIRSLRSDARVQFGEDLTPHQRAVLLEAETDAMWHVLDALVEAVHALETGEGFSARLIE